MRILMAKSQRIIVPIDPSDAVVPDVRRVHLHEDILKSVEQELLNS